MTASVKGVPVVLGLQKKVVSMMVLLKSKVKALKIQVYQTEVRNFSVKLRIHVPTTCIRLKGNSFIFFSRMPGRHSKGNVSRRN